MQFIHLVYEYIKIIYLICVCMNFSMALIIIIKSELHGNKYATVPLRVLVLD